MSTLNPFDPNFKLSACDGPEGARHINPQTGLYDAKYSIQGYVPCNFEGLIIQAQVLINAMIILGILAALGSFTYAGWLLVTGGPLKKNRAKEIFQKVGIGFIMMLTAWFVVYQILDWTVKNQYTKKFFGSPAPSQSQQL